MVIPSIVPRKPLHVVSMVITFRFVPCRMLELEFTSSTAACMAAFADLPMVELKANKAPMFAILGPAAILSCAVSQERRNIAGASGTNFMVKDRLNPVNSSDTNFRADLTTAKRTRRENWGSNLDIKERAARKQAQRGFQLK